LQNLHFLLDFICTSDTYGAEKSFTFSIRLYHPLICTSDTYGAEESLYQQIAKALWQLQMKGDIENALGNTDVWNGVPANSRHDSQIQLANPPRIRPTTAQPTTSKTKRAAFARRETARQVTNRPAPTQSQASGQSQIAPGRIYSNKMNRATARGYGSSLTKLIASKIKFNPSPQPKLPSNPTIDSILGPIAQGSNNQLPSNFIPAPPQLTVNVGKAKSTPLFPENTKPPQPTIAQEDKNNPVFVIRQTEKSDVPLTAFSVVVPNAEQQPASFRIANKEVKNNQLNDKNGIEDKSGFGNDFKDFEINDAPQVIVEEAQRTSKPDVVKKQKIDSKHKRVETETKTVVIKPTPGHQMLPPSRSDISIGNTPTINQHNSASKPAVLGAEIAIQQIAKPEIKAVKSIQFSEPIQDVTKISQSANIPETIRPRTKGLPVHVPSEPSILTTKQPHKITTKPIKAKVPVGSVLEPRQGRPRGSVRSTRPTDGSISQSGKGFSLSRGSTRGRGRNPSSRKTPPWATKKNTEAIVKQISPTQSSSISSTKKESNQSPVINTAQFARRGGSRRVVVNRESTNRIKATRPETHIVSKTENVAASTVVLPARSANQPLTSTTKSPVTTLKPIKAEVPKGSALNPRQGNSRRSFGDTRSTGVGRLPSSGGFSLSKGSGRGSRRNKSGRRTPPWATNKNNKATDKEVSSTQFTSMSSIKKETNQMPAIDTAQFSKRGGSKRVVVSGGNSNNVRTTNPQSGISIKTEINNQITPSSTLTTKAPTITSEPVKEEVPKGLALQPQHGSSRGSFSSNRPTGRGISRSGGGFSLSRGSGRGSRRNTSGGPASMRNVHIPKRSSPPWATNRNTETTTNNISPTQSTSMSSTTTEKNQIPVMNTAQFSRQGGSKRVVVNRGNTNNPGHVDERRGGGIVIPVTDEKVSLPLEDPSRGFQNIENEEISSSVISLNSEIPSEKGSSVITTTATPQNETTQPIATTQEQLYQRPVINTAQFARRGGPRRVVVNRGNTNNLRNDVARSEVEIVQTAVAADNDVPQSPGNVITLNSDTRAENSLSTSTAITNEGPSAVATTPAVATTRRSRRLRPGSE
jgi:hypothetical protein